MRSAMHASFAPRAISILESARWAPIAGPDSSRALHANALQLGPKARFFHACRRNRHSSADSPRGLQLNPNYRDCAGHASTAPLFGLIDGLIFAFRSPEFHSIIPLCRLPVRSGMPRMTRAFYSCFAICLPEEFDQDCPGRK